MTLLDASVIVICILLLVALTVWGCLALAASTDRRDGR